MLKRQLDNGKSREYNDGNVVKHEENQYLNLIDDVLKYGFDEKGRNGMTRAVFGAAMHFSLENNTIPLLTTKKVAWKTCFKELLWFMNGSTDNRILHNQNVKIWNDNASRAFLDSRGLTHLEENDLGPVYGHQWRHFNAPYKTFNKKYEGEGIDQLENIIKCLKNPETRTSRRMVLSAWNPCQINEMALPPCHILCQFNVFDNNKLSCSMYQRSGDIGLGVPFNIASYSFLTHLIAHQCGLEAHEFVYFLGNAHIYDDHFDSLREQVKRKPFKFPTLEILNKPDSIDGYKLEDISIRDYNFHSKISMTMRK